MKAKEMMDSKDVPFDVVPYLTPEQEAFFLEECPDDFPDSKMIQRHDWWNQGRKY